jgi:hypothetical protein
MKNKSQTFIVLFLFVITVFSATAQTYVSGFISSNTTWNLTGSPYVITGNSILTQGTRLTIDPGVEVQFGSGVSLQVEGELIAIGTAQDKINFTSQFQPGPGAWGKIFFTDASINSALDMHGNYLSGTTMQYCNFSYGGSVGNGMIQIEQASPYFNHCVVSSSSTCGINSHGAALLLDSSMVKDNLGAGLIMYELQLTSCGLTIANDSIVNNAGGIYIDGPIGCSTTIRNNYFSKNRDTYYSSLDCGNNNIENIEITGNYFTGNLCNGDIDIDGDNVLIQNNYFINDTVANHIIYCLGQNDTIRCNKFIYNRAGTGVIFFQCANSSIESNEFEGNVNYNNSTIVATVYGWPGYNSFSFVNNTISDNYSTLSTSRCCEFNLDLTGTPHYKIENNNFQYNICNHVIDMTVVNTDPIYSFLSMKNNNFINPDSYFQFYNNTTSSNPGIYIDHNYWGSTSTQFMDSVVYDFFDNSNNSAVYYQPVLSAPVIIDTSCDAYRPYVEELPARKSSCFIFPNPVKTKFTVKFNRTINNGNIILFDSHGREIVKDKIIHSSEKEINVEGLPTGLYVLKVFDGKDNCVEKIIVDGD